MRDSDLEHEIESTAKPDRPCPRAPAVDGNGSAQPRRGHRIPPTYSAASRIRNSAVGDGRRETGRLGSARQSCPIPGARDSGTGAANRLAISNSATKKVTPAVVHFPMIIDSAASVRTIPKTVDFVSAQSLLAMSLTPMGSRAVSHMSLREFAWLHAPRAWESASLGAGASRVSIRRGVERILC